MYRELLVWNPISDRIWKTLSIWYYPLPFIHLWMRYLEIHLFCGVSYANRLCKSLTKNQLRDWSFSRILCRDMVNSWMHLQFVMLNWICCYIKCLFSNLKSEWILAMKQSPCFTSSLNRRFKQILTIISSSINTESIVEHETIIGLVYVSRVYKSHHLNVQHRPETNSNYLCL